MMSGGEGQVTHEDIQRQLQQQGEDLQEIKKAILTLIRVEERQAADRETLKRFGKWLNDLDVRMVAVETRTMTNSKSTNLFDNLLEKFVLLIVGGLVGFIFTLIRMGGHG